MKRKIFLILFIALTVAILQADLAGAGFVMSDIDQMGLAQFDFQVNSSDLLTEDQAISFQFHLNYDANLFEYNGYTAGANLPGILVVNDLIPGVINVGYANADALTGINELMSINLEPFEPCETAITLTEARYNNTDTDINNLTGGNISVVPFPEMGLTIEDVAHQGLSAFNVYVQSNDISAEDGILSYQFSYNYNPEMLEYTDSAIDPDLGGQLVVNAEEPGLINVAYAGYDPISGINDVLIITFQPIVYGYDTQFITGVFMNNYEVTDVTNGMIAVYPDWDEISISVTDADVFTGDQFMSTVNTSFTMPENEILSFQFILTYNPELLEYDGVNEETRLYDLIINDTEPGVLQVAFAISEPIYGEGSVVDFLFIAISDGATQIEITEFVYNNEYIDNLIPGNITITNPNNPPLANAGADIEVLEGEAGMLDGSLSNDPDLDEITYLWTGDLVLDDETAVNPSFTAPEVDENVDYVMTLTVDDGELISTDEVIVTIINVPNPADAVISMEDQDVALDQEFAVNVYTTPLDVDFGVISYQYIVNYDPAVITYTGYSNGTGMPDGTLVVNDTEPGVLQVAFSNPDAITNPDYLTQFTFVGTVIDQAEISLSEFYYNNTPVLNVQPAMISVHESYYFTDVFVENEEAGINMEFTCDIMTEELMADWEVISFQFDLYYDPAMLEFTGYQLGDVPTGGSLLAYEMTTGHLSVAFADYNSLSGTGSIAGFNFIPLQLGSTDVTLENFKYNATYLPNVDSGTIDIIIPFSNAVISAPELTVGGGETFTVGISTSDINPAWGVISFQFNLGFDPELLDFVGFSEGSIITAGNLIAYENADGNVAVAFANFASIGGEGTLIELEFTAAMELDQSVLDLGNFKYNTLFLDNENIYDGLVTIVEPYRDAVITCSDADTREGLDFTVGISTTELQEYWGVISFQFNLGFDPEMMEFTGYEAGNVITSGNLLAFENAAGNITVAFADYMSLSGVGDLIVLEFTALTAGETTLDLNEFKYNALYLDNMVDGNVFIDLGNYPPVANAGVDQVVNEGEEVTLNGTASYDPDDYLRTPDWDFNISDYQYNGSIWGIIMFNGVEVNITTGMLGCFVGDECRGIATAADGSVLDYTVPFGHIIFLPMVNSNVPSGETLTFKYWDAGTNMVFDVEETMEWEADMVIGDGNDPFIFSVTGEPIYDLTFNWLAPDGIILDDPASATPSFTAPWFDADTELVFGLEVFDDQVWSEVDEVVVTVIDHPITEVVISTPEFIFNEDVPFNVPILTTMLQPDMNIISYQFNLYYDPAVLQYDGFSAGELSPNMLVVNNVEPGIINVAYAGSNPIIGAGELLSFQFITLEGGVSPLDIANFKYNNVFINVMDGSVEVIAENDTPIFDLPQMLSFNEDEVHTFDFSEYIDDPDNDMHTITYFGNTIITIEVLGYNVTMSAPYNWFGSETVSFLVDDNTQRAVAFDSAVINVISVNDLPIAIAGEDQLIDEGEMVYLDGTGSYDTDETGLELTYNWIVPQEIVLDDPSSPTPSFAAPWVVGDTDFVIGFEVYDGLDWSEVSELTLTVIDHPITEVVVSIPEVTINENEMFDVAVSTTMLQPDMNILSYEFSLNYDPALLTYEGYAAGPLSPNILVDNTIMPGTISIAYADNIAVTGEGELLSLSFTAIEGGISPLTLVDFIYNDDAIITDDGFVDIFNVNDTPIFDLDDSYSFNEDEELVVDFSQYIIDPDNDMHDIYATDNTEVMIAVDGYMVTFTATENWFGSEPITFSVDDNTNRAVAQDITIINVISVNDAPLLDVPLEMYFDEDGEIIFDIGLYVEDVDEDVLELYVTGMDHLNVEINGLVATITGDGIWNGEELLGFTVDDMQGRATATDECNFVVAAMNDAPTLDLPDYISFNEDEELSYDISTYAEDVDFDVLDIVSVEYDGMNLLNNFTGLTINFSAEENWFGITEVMVTITDNYDRALVSDMITVEVLAVNDVPEINLDPSVTFDEDTDLTIDFASFIFDVDMDQLVLTVSEGVNVHAAIEGYMVTFSADENWNGVELLIFTINDQQGRATSMDTVNVIVNPVNDAPVITEYLPEVTQFNFTDTTYVEFSIDILDIEEDSEITWYRNDGLLPWLDNTLEFPITFDRNGDFVIKVQVADADYMVETSWTINVWMGPDWEPVVYFSNTTAYTRITIDGLPVSELDMVGAFVEGEMRGWDYPRYSEEDDMTYATILVNGIEIEEIDFIIYDYSANKSYELYETFTTNPGGVIGTPPDFINLAFASGEGPNWTPVIYTNSTIVYGYVQVEGMPAESGDRVGVFVGPECRAVADVIVAESDTAFVTLVVQGNTPEIAHFKIWDSSASVIYSVPTTIVTIPGGEIGYPPDQILINATENFTITQNISLQNGWNLISLNIYPTSYQISNIFADLIASEELIKIKNIFNSYDPELLPVYNTLTEFEDGSGYYVKVVNNTSLSVEGQAVNVSYTEIPLSAGWNLTGYLPQMDQDLDVALQTIMSSLLKIKDSFGSYDPSLPPEFNTLTTMNPGSGYWIKMFANATLTYPAGTRDAEQSIAPQCPIWQPVIYTNSTIAYGQASWNGLPAKGFIGAFAGEECRAVYAIDNGIVSLVINGIEKETVSFKLYNNGMVYESSQSYTTDPGNDISDLAIYFATGDAPLVTRLASIYPNPFNPQTTISYDLSQAGNVSVDVYNIKGQKVETLVNSHQDAGEYKLTWNADQQASGVYFLRFLTIGHSETRKVILMK